MKTVKKLARRLANAFDSAVVLDTIARLGETRDEAAIPVLVGVLDTPGPIGRAAVRALVSLGAAAAPAMHDCIENGIDEDTIRNAHRVLAALGDVRSARYQHAICWADLDGLSDAEVAASPGPDPLGTILDLIFRTVASSGLAA
jgi:HEAT repeat protein